MTAADQGADVARWWLLLGGDRRGELVDVRTLAGGASGSAVYLIDISGEAGRKEYVLKVASHQILRARAGRELKFYRDLAHHVPVVVPNLVAAIEHPDATCLLLESAGVAPTPEHWTTARWEHLATELGRLHTQTPTQWIKPPRQPNPAEISDATHTWETLGNAKLLAPLWAKLDTLYAALSDLPTCLRHGDWHLGNLLTDPADRFVWIDWQEVCLGHGPEDLALLWQRAEFDGHNPPRDAMLAAYAEAREIPVDKSLHRATVAAELLLLLIAWPPYLAHAPEPGRARMFHRLERLIDAWKH
jgi:Ser/Thr protein kinase RdoA (MazF antagonist)